MRSGPCWRCSKQPTCWAFLSRQCISGCKNRACSASNIRRRFESRLGKFGMQVVPGIGEVLKNLETTDWGKLLFLHTENMQLEGRKPKDLILEGKSDLVAQLAAQFGEQGAK